jgi:hypothetical protein
MVNTFTMSLKNLDSITKGKLNTLKICIWILNLVLILLVASCSTDKDYAPEGARKIWQECGLQNELDPKVVEMAIEGYKKIRGKRNSETLTIIDFSKPSHKERLYVCDLKNKKLLFKTFVAHGKNSGKLYARNFSNKPESNKSCLGFFLTGVVYKGNLGNSLIIKGLENGINDNAQQRHIVMHPSKFVNQKTIKSRGMIGRSLGCPAIPEDLSDDIINKIKGGSCVFVYADDKNYRSKSVFISSKT